VSGNPKFLRILQEIAVAESEAEVENILWSHRAYVNAMPSYMREGFYEAAADAWRKRSEALTP
jgi:hypothetical protein